MEEKPCKQCGVIFTAQKGRPFCSRDCYYQNLRDRPRKKGVRYRMVSRPEHPIAPPGGVLPYARVVLYDAIGPGPHACNWCGKSVTWHPQSRYSPDALYVDHLNHDPTDDRRENLVPSCNPCNGHRRQSERSNLIKDGELTMTVGNARTRAVRRECESCAAPFLTLPAQVKKGKGRFCSRVCAGDNGWSWEIVAPLSE